MKCPFDPSHVMPHERFLNHLEKCKFADKKSYLKCRFNPYHVIHRDLMDKHEGGNQLAMQSARIDSTTNRTPMMIAGEQNLRLQRLSRKSLRNQLYRPR